MTLTPPLTTAAPMIALIIGVFMVVLDGTAVTVALPTLVTDLHTTLSTLQRIVTGYTLAQAAVIPLAGWLSDRFGAKTVFLTSVALFAAGIGLALASTANAIADVVPTTQTGEAISANAIARTIGSSIGTAASAALLAAHSAAHALPTDAGFTIAFWTGTAVALVGVLATLVAPATRRMPSP